MNTNSFKSPNTTKNSNQLNPEKKSFLNKLYLDPIESLNTKLSETKSRGFRIKTDITKTNTEYSSLPTMQTGGFSPMGMTSPQGQFKKNMNRTLGNVIMQNWETSKNIPPDIGDLIHFPVLVDRRKIKKGFEPTKSLTYATTENFAFSKDKIRKDGEKLLKSL